MNVGYSDVHMWRRVEVWVDGSAQETEVCVLCENNSSIGTRFLDPNLTKLRMSAGMFLSKLYFESLI